MKVVNGFSNRTYARGPCMCVTGLTGTPARSKSEVAIRVLKSYLGREFLENKMGMY